MDNLGLILALAKRGGGVGSSLTLGKGTDKVTLTADELKMLVRNQDVRTWWESIEPVTINYYGATITQEGNLITINGTMTGDNSVGEDTEWENPELHYNDTMLDLTRGLKRMDKRDPLLLYVEPGHIYRYSGAVVSGSMTMDMGNMTGSVQASVGVQPMLLYGRSASCPFATAREDTEMAAFAGEARVARHEIRNSLINSLVTYGVPYDIHGGTLALMMPDVRDGASYTFDNYKVAVSFADVTGLGGYKIGRSEDLQHGYAYY